MRLLNWANRPISSSKDVTKVHRSVFIFVGTCTPSDIRLHFQDIWCKRGSATEMRRTGRKPRNPQVCSTHCSVRLQKYIVHVVGKWCSRCFLPGRDDCQTDGNIKRVLGNIGGYAANPKFVSFVQETFSASWSSAVFPWHALFHWKLATTFNYQHSLVERACNKDFQFRSATTKVFQHVLLMPISRFGVSSPPPRLCFVVGGSWNGSLAGRRLAVLLGVILIRAAVRKIQKPCFWNLQTATSLLSFASLDDSPPV